MARVVLVTALGIAAGTSCQQDERVGSDFRFVSGGGDAGHPQGSGGSSQTDASLDAETHGCVVTLCQGHKYACGNCRDDDGDGLVDMDDPDCLGPCHNAEDTFYGSIPGQDHGTCVEDCYFDQDSGGGNDGCEWSRVCDQLEVAPDYYPSGDRCAYDPGIRLSRGSTCAAALEAQPASCAEVCGPLVPNGCDCFGCCRVPGTKTAIWLGSTDSAGNATCDLGHVGDPARCHPCTQVPSCTNPCETCERCVGKTTLPASCSTGSACPTPQCLRGAPCGADCLPDCPPGQACVTGCCVAPPR